jgi:NAD(P)-dependent dehydrogenase (short-subunit alcohol dehydrogenase family)
MQGIRVNGLAPGIVPTKLSAYLVQSPDLVRSSHASLKAIRMRSVISTALVTPCGSVSEYTFSRWYLGLLNMNHHSACAAAVSK